MKYTLLAALAFCISFTASASGPKAAQCTPQTTSYNVCCNFGILNVTLNTINNTTSGGADGYKDYSGTINTNLLIGKSYAVSIDVSGAGSAKQNVRIWIDYNNDAKLDSVNELAFTATSALNANGTITIPSTAVKNTALRMRVSADYDQVAVPLPCKNLTYGQAEDYSITVLSNPNPPLVAFSADNTITCSGIVKFTDNSQNVPTSWLWSFGDGSTNTVQNPIHTYINNGTYKVKLKATNANGSGVDSIVNYITVTLGVQPKAASCIPATLAYCCQYGITNVTLNTINNTTADGIDGYMDYSCTQRTSLVKGLSYNIAIGSSTLNPQDFYVWIDYNNDGVFSNTTELAFSAGNQENPFGAIDIPSTGVTLGTPLRMRVFADFVGNTVTSCSKPSFGQIEDYSVTITATNGIEKLNSLSDFYAYPNPANSLITIGCKLTGTKQVSISVINDTGQEVIKKTVTATTELTETIDLSKHPRGIYFIRVLNEKEQLVQKIILQ